jgi:hypothetical protein
MNSETKALFKEAQNPKTPVERLTELGGHEDMLVRRAVARNPSVTDAMLLELLGDESWEVRTVAAHHPRAPKDKALELVMALANSDEAGQRALAARSPITPVDTLVKLVGDTDSETRSNAAKNPRTPREVARGRLADPEPCVVMGALCHPSVSREERRAFMTEDLIYRFFVAHTDGEHLFEALCEKYLWDAIERAVVDPERFDEVWQDLVRMHFELIEIPSRGAVLAAVHKDHFKAIAKRLAEEVTGPTAPSGN